jgi:uncharacterized protein
MLQKLEAGISVCVEVALIDGLVLSRSAFHHSMNYRSVIAFGTCRTIGDRARKTQARQVISEHVIPGRWRDVRGPSEKELKATLVLEFLIREASAKIRQGPPVDEEEDYKLPAWAGVLPLILEAKTPIPDPRLAAGVEVPRYILQPRRK